MISGYICKKSKMFAVFTPEGIRVPVTRLVTAPLTITRIINDKTIQVSYGKKHNKEFKITTDIMPKIGDIVTPDLVFTAGDIIHATGKSKGHGFAGVIKRWGFKKQPIKNASDRIRAPGAIGAQTPSKVVKGKKMPGHYGNKTKTILNLKIVSVNKDTAEILVAGSVPGAINSWVTLNKAL